MPMMDLDRFKPINDTYGHMAGDAVLRDVAGMIVQRCRCPDYACRWGGEEFCLLLPDTDEPGAHAWAQRCCAASPSGRKAWRAPNGCSIWPIGPCTRRRRPAASASSATVRLPPGKPCWRGARVEQSPRRAVKTTDPSPHSQLRQIGWLSPLRPPCHGGISAGQLFRWRAANSPLTPQSRQRHRRTAGPGDAKPLPTCGVICTSGRDLTCKESKLCCQ